MNSFSMIAKVSIFLPCGKLSIIQTLSHFNKLFFEFSYFKPDSTTIFTDRQTRSPEY